MFTALFDITHMREYTASTLSKPKVPTIKEGKMKNHRYTVVIDGKEAYWGDHIPYLKKQADFEFQYFGAFFAKIMCYNKVYCTRSHDTEWR